MPLAATASSFTVGRWVNVAAGREVPKRTWWRSPPARQPIRPTGQGSKQQPCTPHAFRTSLAQRSADLLLRATDPISSPGVRSCPSCPSFPLRLSLGPPHQPQQAYVGAAASSTTNTEARRTAPLLLCPSTGIATGALRRSTSEGFLCGRPATGGPAAAVRVMHPSLLFLVRVSALAVTIGT